MTAILKVDTIQDTSGNNIINESSDTITIGASGDTTNIIGTLQNNGSALISGITEVDQFRLTSDLTNPGSANITANLERVDDATFSKMGTGMTESSGIFTFPSTGLYRIQVIGHFYIPSGNDGACEVNTTVSSNSGGAYDTVASAIAGSTAGGQLYGTRPSECFVNVTNASTFRVKFETGSMAAAILVGNTNYNATSFSFIRLGDSQ